MHIGAALIFDPLPGGGTPDIADAARAHARAHAAPAALRPAALGAHAGR